MCNGINNPDLEEFVHHKFGFLYLDEEGYLWGEKMKGWTTYKARMCTGKARDKRADRCDECHRLYKSMVSAKVRHEKSEEAGTQKYTPISSLKVSPYVRDMIAKFREENKPEPEPVNWVFQDSIKVVKKNKPGLPSYALGKLADSLHCVSKPTQVSL